MTNRLVSNIIKNWGRWGGNSLGVAIHREQLTAAVHPGITAAWAELGRQKKRSAGRRAFQHALPGSSAMLNKKKKYLWGWERGKYSRI